MAPRSRASTPTPRRSTAPSSARRLTSRADRSARRWPDADAVFCAAPVGALPALVSEALEASGADAVVTDVGSTKRGLIAELARVAGSGALHRRPSIGGRRDVGDRACARRPVRGRAVVSGPHAELERAAVRPPAQGDRRAGRAPARDRRRHARPGDGDRQPSSARDRQRARGRGRGGARRGLGASARGGAQLSRHDAGRRAPTPRSGRTSSPATARRWRARSTRSSSGCASAAELLRSGDAVGLAEWHRGALRGPPPPARGRARRR